MGVLDEQSTMMSEWLIEPDNLETMIKPSEEKMRLLRRDYKSGKEFQMPA